MPTTKTVNPLDLVNAMAGKTVEKKGGKPGKPTVQIDSLDDRKGDDGSVIPGPITTFLEQKAAEATAKALKEAAEQQILSNVGPERLKACVRAGEVHASIGVNDRLTFTLPRKYSVVPQEHAEDLEKTFGDDYSRYFDAQLAIGLAPGAANDEAVLAKLIELVGAEFFQANFEVRRDLKVTEAFHKDWSTKTAVQETAAPFFADHRLKMNKASLKRT